MVSIVLLCGVNCIVVCCELYLYLQGRIVFIPGGKWLSGRLPGPVQGDPGGGDRQPLGVVMVIKSYREPIQQYIVQMSNIYFEIVRSKT